MPKKQARIFLYFCLCLLFAGASSARAQAFSEGDIITAEESPVYYFGFDKKLHPFPNAAVYHSWFEDFSGVEYVSKEALGGYQISWPVCVRPGTWLVSFAGGDRIYGAEPGCGLRPLRSETEAFVLYGRSWKTRVVVLDTIHKSFYRVRGFENSKSALDTDSDGVTDYEEEVYWGSAAADADTDGDGRSDRDEIFAGYSPLGSNRIESLGVGVYAFPFGSIVRGPSETGYYYKSTSGNMYFMNKITYTGGGTYNGFHTQFLIHPAFGMSLSERQKGVITKEEKRLFFPNIEKDGNIILQ